jgi:hypothetical protein
MRASDERRERTVAALRERALDGCLTLDTFAGRVDAAYRAKTVEELDVLVADLPHSDGWRAAMRRTLARLTHVEPPSSPALEIEVRLPASAEIVTLGRSRDRARPRLDERHLAERLAGARGARVRRRRPVAGRAPHGAPLLSGA